MLESYGVGGTYQGTSHREYSIDSVVEALPQTLTISTGSLPAYVSKEYAQGLYLSPKAKDYCVLGQFLTHAYPTEFVNDAKLIEAPVREAFKATTGKELPRNIVIRLCDESELKKAHQSRNGVWSHGIHGFSINRGLKGTSEVFVKKGFMDEVMVTLGHELGHVISPSLQDARDEEAKAFAFSSAWMRIIVDNNIAGLTNAINPSPAKNGVHDVGFDFVQEELKKGVSAFDVFMALAQGLKSITERLETVLCTKEE